ncbi:uncharacterized protein LOC123933830 [Meles meles]|uniref:uncharacterized protein LOC123933830 n=1 Tax=Meles meles TaxID=9662 RepID=UPI001E6A007F|nr:uncharacterized protein LOC123933830 [Meles meles]
MSHSSPCCPSCRGLCSRLPGASLPFCRAASVLSLSLSISVCLSLCLPFLSSPLPCGINSRWTGGAWKRRLPFGQPLPAQRPPPAWLRFVPGNKQREVSSPGIRKGVRIPQSPESVGAGGGLAQQCEVNSRGQLWPAAGGRALAPVARPGLGPRRRPADGRPVSGHGTHEETQRVRSLADVERIDGRPRSPLARGAWELIHQPVCAEPQAPGSRTRTELNLNDRNLTKTRSNRGRRGGGALGRSRLTDGQPARPLRAQLMPFGPARPYMPPSHLSEGWPKPGWLAVRPAPRDTTHGAAGTDVCPLSQEPGGGPLRRLWASPLGW